MLVRRVVLVTGATALVFAITLSAGLRQGLLTLLGLGFGAVLQGCRFGFTTGWRDYIERRNPHGLWAQLLLLALASGLMLPLLAAHPGELVGAVAPLTLSLLLGAFLFGAAMQLTDGCGSGTLYKAGAGSPLSVVVLPTFVLGSFLGASHQPAWVALGGLPPVDLLRYGWPTALALTLAGCALVALLTLPHARSAGPWPRRWVIGAILLALLAALHLIVAGQPWGIVYGVGLWGAKAFAALGWNPAADPFWSVAPHATRLVEPIVFDVTSVTNFGLLYGAYAVSRWRAPVVTPLPSARRLLVAATAGLILGYSSRMAFGCNVGAFLGGVSSASLHGWIWFAMAFLGSILGVRLRRRIEATAT